MTESADLGYAFLNNAWKHYSRMHYEDSHRFRALSYAGALDPKNCPLKVAEAFRWCADNCSEGKIRRFNRDEC